MADGLGNRLNKNWIRKYNEKFNALIKEANAEYKEAFEKLKEVYKGQFDGLKDLAELVNKNGQLQKENPVKKFLFGERNKYKDIYDEMKKFEQEQKRLEEMFKDDPEKLKTALALYKKKYYQDGASGSSDEDGLVGKLSDKVTNDLNDALADVFTNFDEFDNFGKNFKKVFMDLGKDVLKTTASSVLETVINEENLKAVFSYARTGLKWLGQAVTSIFKAIPSVFGEGSPTGAAANIPGLLNFSAVGKSKVGEESTSGGMEAMFSKMTEYFTKTFSAEGPFGSVISMFTNSFSTLFGSNGLFGSLFNALGGMFSSVFSSLGGILGGAGSSGIGSFLVSAASSLLLFHSGGTVPQGANTKLPGTKEQLALLKGGERILSPGENVQYERENQTPTVNVLNFNIKAWDSKDVQKYLLENRQLLNSITAQGIKDNNQHLRTMVKYA